MTTDFNQAQNELDNFLDQTFNNTKPQDEPKKSPDDEIIDSYLTPADVPEEQQPDSQQPAAYTESQQAQQAQQRQQPLQPSADERLLALERELAATKTRAQMYENALAQRYEQAAQQQQQPQSFDVFADHELQVEERYIKDYGDADPYIAAIARRVANEMNARAVQPLYQEIQNLRGQLDQQQANAHYQQRDIIYTQLKSIVPDLDTLASSPEWQSYIQQPDVYGGTRPIAHYVQEGIKSGNVRQVAAIIDNFKKARQKSQPQQQHVAPGRAPNFLPQTQQRQGKILNMRDFDRATADFQAGKLSWDRYQVIADEFNTAMLEGRVK